MLGGKFERLDKLTGDKLIVGYDLGNRYSQISYCTYSDPVPQTVSLVAGTEIFNIPTVLCKRKGVNQWFYGREAYRHASEEEGTLVDNLLPAARKGEAIVIEGEEFSPVALLTLFVKRSLNLLSMAASSDKIGAMMITCDVLEPGTVDILSQVAAGLGLKTKNICLQGYVESFYHYTISQPQDIWSHQVVVFTCLENAVSVYRLECNKRTTPIVVFIQEEEYPFRNPEVFPEEEPLRQEIFRGMDERFLQIAGEACEGRLITTVYLIGEGFKEDWMKDSLRYLCKNRRVFQGNNLYSKGACYGMREKLCPGENSRKYVFLGNEKLKANIGMKVLHRGVDAYFPLLDAGMNWFEASKDCDFILEWGNAFSLLATPLTGKDAKLVEILLDGLPERGVSATRLGLHVTMPEAGVVQLQIADKGFGEIFPSSGRIWIEKFEV